MMLMKPIINVAIIPKTSHIGTLISSSSLHQIPACSGTGFYVIRGFRPSVEGGVSRYPAQQGRLLRSRGKSPGPGEASVHQPSTVRRTPI